MSKSIQIGDFIILQLPDDEMPDVGIVERLIDTDFVSVNWIVFDTKFWRPQKTINRSFIASSCLKISKDSFYVELG